MATTHLDVGLRCIKYLLCAVNSLFVITGVMIISVGTTIYAIYEDFSHFLDPSYFSPATVLIVVGAMIFVIAFLGCCGAIKESTCMILVFAVSLSLVLVMEFAAAISAYALQGGIKSLLAEHINATMYDYEQNSEAKVAVDFMQSRLRCCGFDSYLDWKNVLSDETNGQGVPDSCCAWNTVVNEFNNITECAGIYEEGCIGRLSIIVHRSALYLGTGAIAIALIQMTGIMFACMLGKAVRRQKIERERRRWELRESIVNGYEPIGKTDPLTTYPVVYMQSPDYPLKKESI
ncbi:CD63 antigen [Cephus cinctus]|uniref:Tetraspanin n=1 Tax=Cephus cinctus TaxID=211228 RepID=A0AAJ7C9N0_CEPCN|nr:CD63 antigen [Cephus cinctus]